MTLTDLRPELAAAYEQAAVVASAIRPGQVEGKTPCAKMDVSELLDHLVFAARRAAALGRGEEPVIETSAPHVELDEVAGTLRAAAADAAAGWSVEGSLERVIKMPWGEEYPGRVLAAIYFVELATHSWDLAVATGTQDRLDAPLGAAALECARATIRPEFRTESGDPFGPEVAAPDDATDWERLGAFMGRTPSGIG